MSTDEIQPGRLYDTPTVAKMLDLHPKTVYAIPEKLLRRTRIGAKRGKVKIRGQAILDYLDNKAA